jgi:hypothetical protein
MKSATTFATHITNTTKKNEDHKHEQKVRSQNLINIQEEYQIPKLDYEHNENQKYHEHNEGQEDHKQGKD